MCGMSQNLTINRTALSTALKLPGTVGIPTFTSEVVKPRSAAPRRVHSYVL